MNNLEKLRRILGKIDNLEKEYVDRQEDQITVEYVSRAHAIFEELVPVLKESLGLQEATLSTLLTIGKMLSRPPSYDYEHSEYSREY